MKGIFIYLTISCFSLYRYRQKIFARLPETGLDVAVLLICPPMVIYSCPLLSIKQRTTPNSKIFLKLLPHF